MNARVRTFRALQALVGKEFSYGTTDCNALCVRALQAFTGRPVWDYARGRWDSEESARRLAQETSLTEYLERIGLQRYPFHSRPSEFSIAVIPKRRFAPSFVIIGSTAFSSEEVLGVIKLPVRNVPPICIAFGV